MSHSSLTPEGRRWATILLAFAGIATLAAADVALDLREGTSLGHVLAEVLAFTIALAGVVVTARRLATETLRARTADERADALAERLRVTEEEARRWRQEAGDLLEGLGAALDRQFERWRLSPAEKEVALLLLKGLSHKEVADVRTVTEATARQQARALYRKAGLTGRADLAAFFLEDLMVPPTQEKRG